MRAVPVKERSRSRFCKIINIFPSRISMLPCSFGGARDATGRAPGNVGLVVDGDNGRRPISGAEIVEEVARTTGVSPGTFVFAGVTDETLFFARSAIFTGAVELEGVAGTRICGASNFATSLFKLHRREPTAAASFASWRLSAVGFALFCVA